MATTNPTVTVIVLNYNGVGHLNACFTSLSRLDYPPELIELIMVDSGSTDDSVACMEDAFPHVRIVQLGQNLGFAAGNNRGVDEASGEHIVFLNNDTRVDPSFLTGLEDAMASDPEAVCVGAKLLNWEGTRFDFAGSTCNFAGFGAQIGYGERYDPSRFVDVKPILFACGGAMLIDRRTFLASGGFDESYFAFFEDVDLGWRLWLHGHKVLFAPNAVVYHRHHGTIATVPGFRKAVLYHRNALVTVIKNYEARNLSRVLPTALLALTASVVDTAARVGQLDLSSFGLPNTGPWDREPVMLDKSNVSTLVAIHDVAENLPSIFEKRQQIQAQRRRSDDEIASMLQLYAPPIGKASAEIVTSAADRFGVLEIFADIPRRTLVVSPDVLPYEGMPSVGSGLRAWGLAEGLRAMGHEVTLAMPRVAAESFSDRLPSEAWRIAWDSDNLHERINFESPDVVVLCGWPLAAALTEHPAVPVVLDLAGPHLMEREFSGAGTPRENVKYKLAALRLADYLTCSGSRQYDYFVGWLERAGWKPEDIRQRTTVIPFSIDPNLPSHEGSNEPTFVCGGIFLQWHDPSSALTAVVDELERRATGRLRLIRGKHPWGGVETGISDELFARLGRSERVSLSEFLPYDELGTIFSRADVAIDLMQRNRESELAFTTRTVVYLWHGLPVIYNNYSELSEYIDEYDAGWTLDPEDQEALRAVLDEIFEGPDRVIVKSRNAQRLVRERLTWDRTIEPLERFVRRPSIRPHTPRRPTGAAARPSLLAKVRHTYRVRGVTGLARKTIQKAKRWLPRPSHRT